MSGLMDDSAAWIGSAWKSHWKIVVAVAAGTVVAIAATALILGTGGTATPILFLAAGASGTLGAGTTQTVDDLLEHKHPGVDVVESAALGGAVSVATLGVGRALAPVVPASVARFLPGAVKPLDDEAEVVGAAIQKNIPWGAIPRIVFNEPISDFAQRAEVGLVGALGGAEAHRSATPAPSSSATPPATEPALVPSTPASPQSARVPLDGALGD